MAHSIGMDEPDDDFSNLGVPARSVAEVSGRARALVYLILTISVFLSWLFLLAMSRRAAEVDPGPGGALLLALPSLKLPDIFEAFFLMCFSPVVDRKSTRLNSSHVKISYAVFCLKKKKKTKQQHQ